MGGLGGHHTPEETQRPEVRLRIPGPCKHANLRKDPHGEALKLGSNAIGRVGIPTEGLFFVSLWCKWYVFEAICALAGVDVPVLGVVFPRHADFRQIACEWPLLRGVTFRWHLNSSACWAWRCDVGYSSGAILMVSFDGTHRSQTRAPDDTTCVAVPEHWSTMPPLIPTLRWVARGGCVTLACAALTCPAVVSLGWTAAPKV